MTKVLVIDDERPILESWICHDPNSPQASVYVEVGNVEWGFRGATPVVGVERSIAAGTGLDTEREEAQERMEEAQEEAKEAGE